MDEADGSDGGGIDLGGGTGYYIDSQICWQTGPYAHLEADRYCCCENCTSPSGSGLSFQIACQSQSYKFVCRDGGLFSCTSDLADCAPSLVVDCASCCFMNCQSRPCA